MTERRQLSLVERWRLDRWPERPAPRLVANRVLDKTRCPEKVFGCALGAAVGEAYGLRGRPPRGSDSWPDRSVPLGPLEFGALTQASIREANAFVQAKSIEPVDLNREWERLRQDPDDASGAVVRSGFAIARWSRSNLAGVAEIARVFGSLGAPTEAEVGSRIALQLLMRFAVVLPPRDPFWLAPQSGAGSSIPLLLKYVPVEQVDVLGAALSGDIDSIDVGHPARTLCAAVRAFRSTTSYAGCVQAARGIAIHTKEDLGSVCMISGLIAGGTYGRDTIPQDLIDDLTGTFDGKRYTAADIDELTTNHLTVEQTKPTR